VTGKNNNQRHRESQETQKKNPKKAPEKGKTTARGTKQKGPMTKGRGGKWEFLAGVPNRHGVKCGSRRPPSAVCAGPRPRQTRRKQTTPPKVARQHRLQAFQKAGLQTKKNPRRQKGKTKPGGVGDITKGTKGRKSPSHFF